ncbi:MAG: phosphoribosylglycinamide formyltransferase [Deltaproteobacteria bacterium]|nr:phosphoribosylglycinamide formyltransferase [Deltaproteobacteria bacterium]
MTLALGVLISGRGSNLMAILDAVASGTLDARVHLVASNRADAGGLEHARAAGVTTAFVDHRAFPDRASFERELVARLRDAGAEWLVLAGFMRVVTAELLDAFPGRVLNIHPSILPAFPGLDAQAQALAYGVTVTGCTVHLVDEGVDHGPILAQAALALEPSESRDDLAARLLPLEHALLIATLQRIAAGDLTVEPPASAGGRPQVRFRGGAPRAAGASEPRFGPRGAT